MGFVTTGPQVFNPETSTDIFVKHTHVQVLVVAVVLPRVVCNIMVLATTKNTVQRHPMP